MSALVLHQRWGPLGRSIYSVDAATPEALLHLVSSRRVEGRHFVLFLAWDARTTPDEAMLTLVRELVRGGLSYVVAWGPDCERVHDIFDDADILENPESNEAGAEAVVMSTWHADQPLQEALWFAVNSAYPAGRYNTTTTSLIAAVVANEHWFNIVRAYLGDLAKLDAAVGV